MRKRRELVAGETWGQPGHEYKGYEFKTPDKIVRVVPKETICHCGGELVLSEEYSAHQKIEIPPIKPFVTEYRLHASCCKICARSYETKLDNYKLLQKNAESVILFPGYN